MRPSWVSRYACVAILCLSAGCANSFLRSPIQSFKKMRAKGDEPAEKVVDASPFKPSNDHDRTSEKNFDDLASSTELSGHSTTKLPQNSATTVASHNVDLLQTIEAELSDATPEWRNEVFENLKGVDPAMVPVMLRTFKQAWQMSQKRQAQSEIQPIVPGSRYKTANTTPDTNRAVSSQPTIPITPSTGLGTANPWNRSQPIPQTNPSNVASMPEHSNDLFSPKPPSQFGNAGLRSPSQLETLIATTGPDHQHRSVNRSVIGTSPSLNNQFTFPAMGQQNVVPQPQTAGHSVTLGPIEFDTPSQPSQQTGPLGNSTGRHLQRRGTSDTTSLPNGFGTGISQIASNVNNRGLSVNQANVNVANPSTDQNPIVQPGPMTSGGVYTAEHYSDLNSNTAMASRYSTNPPSQSVWQDSMAGSQAPWTAELEQLISMAETEIAQLNIGTTDSQRDNYIRKHVHLRMLYLMAGRHERALQAVPYIDSADQEFWQQMFWAIANYFDTQGMPNSADRATQTIAQLKSATLRLQGKARLELRNVTFCHKISSYGNYERFKRDEFSPGQPVLVYAEVDNFKSEPSADGQFRTILKSTVEIYKAGPNGDLVHREEFPATEDLCSNQRRDYFHSYEITIPQRISLGPHVLKLTAEDRLSQKIATYSLNFTVK